MTPISSPATPEIRQDLPPGCGRVRTAILAVLDNHTSTG